jgi:integrase/recombinase XerD
MSQPLATVATQFLERLGLAKSTIRSYESALMPLLSQYGRWPIELLDRQTLEDYFNGLNQVAYTTHHRHQAIVQALFNFAVEHAYIAVNPITRLKRRKPDRAKGEHHCDQVIRYLSEHQMRLVYQLARRDLRINALIHLLHRTGARIFELLALNVEEVDLEQRRFQVIGKGNKKRWCFYCSDAAEALEQYLKHARHQNTPALFTAQQQMTRQVNRLSYRTAYQHWKNLIQGHDEIAGIRLHDLRHTFATERVGLISIEELRALMGHENIQTTLRYQKVTSQKAEEAAQKAFQKLAFKSSH